MYIWKESLERSPRITRLKTTGFLLRYPHIEEVFQNVLHSDGSMFREAVHHFISLTTAFSALVSQPIHC